MSPQAVKHTRKEEATMKQLIAQLGPKTRLAKLTLANWNAEKAARLRKPNGRGDAGITRIDLDQLDDSPFQLRQEMDNDELAELVRSIEEHGLLNPILVRRVGEKYQVISGHRRLAAYRRLQLAAKTDADKAKYAAIPARELPHVDDEQMLLLGLTENLLRADISPLDAALGLVQLRKLRPALSTANKIAETTGLQVEKIKRLLRLADAPEVVQKGVREGLMVTVGRDGKEQPSEDGAEGQRRTLDLLAALEFARLHEAVSKKVRALKNGASPADKQTGEAIARALKGNWGLREVKRYVDKIVSQPAARPVKKGPGRPGVPFKRTAKQLVVYFDRLDALSGAARQSVRKTLEELLKRLAARPKEQR